MIPDHLRYTQDHEWADIQNDEARIGITDFAQGELGDITFVELPNLGATLTRGKECATVESVKAASDVYAPLSGEVLEVNSELEEAPELVNQSPYEKGWILKIRLSDPSEAEALMDAAEYKKHSGEA